MAESIEAKAFEDLLRSVHDAPLEMSLWKLLDRLGLSGQPLHGARIVEGELAKRGVVIRPPIGEGGLDDKYELVIPLLHEWSHDPVESIASGEHHHQEFKETLYFDVRRSRHDEHASLKQLKSDAVLHSSLKSLCAFANSQGGTLWVGVDDSGEALGLKRDVRVLGLGEELTDSAKDRLELHLRDLLGARFRPERRMNNLVRVDFPEVQAVSVLRLRVRRSTRLVSVRGEGGRMQAFCRQGNRTEELSMDTIEDFLIDRSQTLRES